MKTLGIDNIIGNEREVRIAAKGGARVNARRDDRGLWRVYLGDREITSKGYRHLRQVRDMLSGRVGDNALLRRIACEETTRPAPGDAETGV